MEKKLFFIKQGIFIFIASVVAVLVAIYEKKVLPEEYATTIRLFCDGTSVSAIIFLFIGIMQFISRRGMFDSFGYALARFKKSPVTYLDYVQHKQEKRKNSYAKNQLLFITTGSFMLVLSLCSLLLIK